MRVELLDPADLIASDLNTRTPVDLAALKASIAERGVLRSGIVTEGGVVLAGWHRRLACLELGVPYPAVVVGNLSQAATAAVLMADNTFDEITHRAPLTATLGEEVLPGWYLGRVNGRVGKMVRADRVKFQFLDSATRHGARGSVVVDGDGTVLDDWAWACWYVLTGEPALLRCADSEIDVRSVARWVADGDARPHPSAARFGVKHAHRRLSPLWRLVLDDEPGRVLDIGCGWGSHHALVPADWKVTAYEPYRRRRGTEVVDKRWVRNAIRGIASDVTDHGRFDHVVVDHVLFLAGSDEAAEVVVGAAAALVADNGTVWVSSMWERTKAVHGDLGDGWRIHHLTGTRYLMRSWGREELTEMLERWFDDVEFKWAGESHLYRCRGPKRQDRDAVAVEFDLPWEDDTRPGVVDELLEVLWPEWS